MSSTREYLLRCLEPHLDARAHEWLVSACAECEALPHQPEVRFPTLISLASRKVPAKPLAPTLAQRATAHELVSGWNPERWTVLEAVRAVLVLSRAHLAGPQGVAILDEVFRHADIGELCALYKTLQLLPDNARFTWRAGEGCRSSMSAVYEAAACDTGFPYARFDDVAWRQLIVKALFVGAPLHRVYGLDGRMDEELARIVLDFVEERRSAQRGIVPATWACLGRNGGARARASLLTELGTDHAAGRAGALLGLARAGHTDDVKAYAARGDSDPLVQQALVRALAARPTQDDYAPLFGL